MHPGIGVQFGDQSLCFRLGDIAWEFEAELGDPCLRAGFLFRAHVHFRGGILSNQDGCQTRLGQARSSACGNFNADFGADRRSDRFAINFSEWMSHKSLPSFYKDPKLTVDL